MKKTHAAWLVLSACAIFHAALFAQASRSTWDGIYTAEQAKRGADLYSKQCASCHGDALEGKGQTPPLAGDDFKSNWNGQKLEDLFDRIQISMPADHPGTLRREQNADLVAFLLSFNKFPAGQAELGSDPENLGRIRFETARPKN